MDIRAERTKGVLIFHERFFLVRLVHHLEQITMTIDCGIQPSKVIDLDSLSLRCMGNKALIEKLLLAFQKSLPVERAALQNAIDSSDFGAAAKVAHKLRGTASNMCSLPLSNVAEGVEQAARDNNLNELESRWSELSHQIELLLNELSACIGGNHG